MAVRINMKDLTLDHKKIIRSMLYMQPETKGFTRRKKFFTTPKDPILMYFIDKPKNEILIPYTFGNCLLKYNINSRLKYFDTSYKFTGKLREYQTPVYDKCINQLYTKGTTILGAYPSFGKTIVSAAMSSQFNGLTLVLYPLKILQNGWSATYSRFTDANIWINDGSKNNVFDFNKHNVILTMDTQFHKIPMTVLRQVKTLIIDECHMFCTPSRKNYLLSVTPLYIIACTATLERSDSMESIIYSICGQHGVFLKYPHPFTVYKLFTNISVKVEKNNRGETNWSALVKAFCENEERNKIILDLVLKNPNFKIMVLTWNKNHAYHLRDLFVANGISSDVLAGNKNEYKDSQVLVGTAQKIGTAFDESLSCPDWSGIRSNILMLVGSTKSLSGLHQFCGRVFRAKYPIIMDFVDNNPICKRHWSERKKYYLDPDTKGTVIEINCGKPDINKGEIKGEINQKRIKSMNSKSVSRAKARLNIVSGSK